MPTYRPGDSSPHRHVPLLQQKYRFKLFAALCLVSSFVVGAFDMHHLRRQVLIQCPVSKCSNYLCLPQSSHTTSLMMISSSGGPKDKGKTMRLDRFLSNNGFGSRTEVARLIKQGAVKTTAGEVIKSPSTHVVPGSILVKGQAVGATPLLVAYNKPIGVHSTFGDPLNRTNLLDVLPKQYHKTLHPVGRLDADSSGLLLFSSNGQLTHRLLHPSKGIEREYLATVEGTIHVPALTQKLAEGVETTDGTFPARVLDAHGQVVRLSVTEGKYRMVRRMLNNAGYPVTALHRIRYGAIELGDLEEGGLRVIDKEQLEWAESIL